jgi:hypothetical protein
MGAGKIAAVRGKAIEAMRSYIRNLQKELYEGKCSGRFYDIECDALQLGHFMRMCSRHKLCADEDSYETWNSSLRHVVGLFDSIEIRFLPDYSDKRCSWVPSCQAFMKETLEGVQGLTFEDFPSRRKRVS